MQTMKPAANKTWIMTAALPYVVLFCFCAKPALAGTADDSVAMGASTAENLDKANKDLAKAKEESENAGPEDKAEKDEEYAKALMKQQDARAANDAAMKNIETTSKGGTLGDALKEVGTDVGPLSGDKVGTPGEPLKGQDLGEALKSVGTDVGPLSADAGPPANPSGSSTGNPSPSGPPGEAKPSSGAPGGELKPSTANPSTIGKAKPAQSPNTPYQGGGKSAFTTTTGRQLDFNRMILDKAGNPTAGVYNSFMPSADGSKMIATGEYVVPLGSNYAYPASMYNASNFSPVTPDFNAHSAYAKAFPGSTGAGSAGSIKPSPSGGSSAPSVPSGGGGYQPSQLVSAPFGGTGFGASQMASAFRRDGFAGFYDPRWGRGVSKTPPGRKAAGASQIVNMSDCRMVKGVVADCR